MIRIKGLSHEMKAFKKHLSQSVTGDESFHKKLLSQSDPCGCTIHVYGCIWLVGEGGRYVVITLGGIRDRD